MSKQFRIELNSNGVVQNRGIHDASIVEAAMSGEGENISAIVRCRSGEGVQFIFRVEGVRLFTVGFFGFQNVIKDCVLITKRDAQEPLAG